MAFDSKTRALVSTVLVDISIFNANNDFVVNLVGVLRIK